VYVGNNADQRFVRGPTVQVGGRRWGKRVEIVSGLQAGETRVVVETEPMIHDDRLVSACFPPAAGVGSGFGCSSPGALFMA